MEHAVTATEGVLESVKAGEGARARSFGFHRNATFISLTAGYIGYYLCRQNFSEAYAPMHASLGMDKLAFGTIASAGTLAYAVGKFALSPLADSYGGRRVFLAGLAGSVVASLVFGAGSGTLAFFLIAWTMNRASQSVGWGSMVSIVGRWFPAREYGRAMGLASVSYQLGGVIAMLFAGVLLAWGAGWRELFWIPAIVLAGIGLIIRPFIWQSPREAGFPGESAEGGLPASPTALAASQPAEPVPGFVARVALVARNPGFLVMVLLSFVLTLLRECFTLWMPAYFSDLGATASMAAFKSSLFPLLGCAGTLFAGWYSDRVSRGRRGPVLAIFLLGLALSLGGMAFTHDRNLGLGLVGLAGFFLLGPYSMVGGGVVALDLGGPRAAATAAGILDSVGYLAATLAGFGVAQLVTARGWNFAFAVMTGLAAASFVLALVAARMGKVSHDSE